MEEMEEEFVVVVVKFGVRYCIHYKAQRAAKKSGKYKNLQGRMGIPTNKETLLH